LNTSGSGTPETGPSTGLNAERHILRAQEDLWVEALRMAGVVESALTMSVTALCLGRPELAVEVKLREREIDRQEVRIESECLRVLALYEPVASDFRRVLTILRVNRNLERISDLAARIAKRTSRLGVNPNPVPIPEPLESLATAALEAVRRSLDSLTRSDTKEARAVIDDDRLIDKWRRTVRDGLTESIRNEPERVEDWLRLLDIARHLERVGDHAASIAEAVVYLNEGQIIRHAQARAGS
jgi:phosphate transport system protein